MSSLGHVVQHRNKIETFVFSPNFLLPSSDSFTFYINVRSGAPPQKTSASKTSFLHLHSKHIFPLQPSLLSCWNMHLCLHHFQTRLLQQHPLPLLSIKVCSKLSCLVAHRLTLQRIYQSDHPSASLAIHWARSSSSPSKALSGNLTDSHSLPSLWRGQPSHLHH